MGPGRLGPLSVLATLVWVSACTIERADVRTPDGEPPEADTIRVRRAVEAIAAAFNAGDVRALDTLYHDSVLVYESGRIDRGWAAYRDEHLIPEIRELEDRELEFAAIDVRLADGTGWATVRYTLDAIHRGDTVSVRGVGTLVFQEVAGRWRVVHSHTSSPR